MLKLVIDTNLVISALLRPQSNPALIISLILRGDCRLCLSEDIFTEYEEVLARKKFNFLDRARVRELLSTLKKRALWVVPEISVDGVALDPADNAFLECALAAKADFLITGNIKHFPIKKFHHIRIATPAEFMNFFIK